MRARFSTFMIRSSWRFLLSWVSWSLLFRLSICFWIPMTGRESELRPTAAAEVFTPAILQHSATQFTYLVGPLVLLLLPIRLIQLVLQLPLQVLLGVHNVQVFIIVMIPLIFILTAAADVIKYLPQLVMF